MFLTVTIFIKHWISSASSSCLPSGFIIFSAIYKIPFWVCLGFIIFLVIYKSLFGVCLVLSGICWSCRSFFFLESWVYWCFINRQLKCRYCLNWDNLYCGFFKTGVCYCYCCFCWVIFHIVISFWALSLGYIFLGTQFLRGRIGFSLWVFWWPLTVCLMSEWWVGWLFCWEYLHCWGFSGFEGDCWDYECWLRGQWIWWFCRIRRCWSYRLF